MSCDHEWPDRISEMVSQFLQDVAAAEEEMILRSLGTGLGIRTTESVSTTGLCFQVELTSEVPYLTLERIVN